MGAPLNNDRGFTLIEILIGIVIIVLVVGIISTTSIVSWRSQKYNFEKSANIESERQIITILGHEIRNATQITSPLEGATAVFTYQREGAPYRTISLGAGDDANTIVFKDAVGTIQKRIGIGRVQSIQFFRVSQLDKGIEIILTMKSLPGAAAPSNSISTIIYSLN